LSRVVASPADIAPAPVDTGEPWFVIVNPMAGRSRRNARAWQSMQAALDGAGVRFEVAVTAGPGDGARIAAWAWTEGHRRFLVAGGDGSAHDVVNGLMQARHDAGITHGVQSRDLPTLVPLPLGTGNDWARSLRLPRAPTRLARLVRHGHAVPHDVGRIDFPGAVAPARASCWFINVAGAGFDAHVIERMPAQTPSGAAYLIGALRELNRYRSPLFRIEAGAAPVTGRMLLAFVANGRYCGGRMLVAPQARQDDGAFDVVTIAEVARLRALPKLIKLYTGGLQGDPLAQHRVSGSVLIESDPRTGVEADGQWVGQTPARFTLVSGALRVLRGD
jgi:YegS/Rv2252/BmrU family lipid kinase